MDPSLLMADIAAMLEDEVVFGPPSETETTLWQVMVRTGCALLSSQQRCQLLAELSRSGAVTLSGDARLKQFLTEYATSGCTEVQDTFLASVHVSLDREARVGAFNSAVLQLVQASGIKGVNSIDLRKALGWRPRRVEAVQKALIDARLVVARAVAESKSSDTLTLFANEASANGKAQVIGGSFTGASGEGEGASEGALGDLPKLAGITAFAAAHVCAAMDSAEAQVQVDTRSSHADVEGKRVPTVAPGGLSSMAFLIDMDGITSKGTNAVPVTSRTIAALCCRNGVASVVFDVDKDSSFTGDENSGMMHSAAGEEMEAGPDEGSYENDGFVRRRASSRGKRAPTFVEEAPSKRQSSASAVRPQRAATQKGRARSGGRSEVKETVKRRGEDDDDDYGDEGSAMEEEDEEGNVSEADMEHASEDDNDDDDDLGDEEEEESGPRRASAGRRASDVGVASIVARDPELTKFGLAAVHAALKQKASAPPPLPVTPVSFSSSFSTAVDTSGRTRRRYNWTSYDFGLLRDAMVADRVEREVDLQAAYVRERIRYLRNVQNFDKSSPPVPPHLRKPLPRYGRMAIALGLDESSVMRRARRCLTLDKLFLQTATVQLVDARSRAGVTLFTLANAPLNLGSTGSGMEGAGIAVQGTGGHSAGSGRQADPSASAGKGRAAGLGVSTGSGTAAGAAAFVAVQLLQDSTRAGYAGPPACDSAVDTALAVDWDAAASMKGGEAGLGQPSRRHHRALLTKLLLACMSYANVPGIAHPVLNLPPVLEAESALPSSSSSPAVATPMAVWTPCAEALAGHALLRDAMSHQGGFDRGLYDRIVQALTRRKWISWLNPYKVKVRLKLGGDDGLVKSNKRGRKVSTGLGGGRASGRPAKRRKGNKDDEDDEEDLNEEEDDGESSDDYDGADDDEESGRPARGTTTALMRTFNPDDATGVGMSCIRYKGAVGVGFDFPRDFGPVGVPGRFEVTKGLWHALGSSAVTADMGLDASTLCSLVLSEASMHSSESITPMPAEPEGGMLAALLPHILSKPECVRVDLSTEEWSLTRAYLLRSSNAAQRRNKAAEEKRKEQYATNLSNLKRLRESAPTAPPGADTVSSSGISADLYAISEIGVEDFALPDADGLSGELDGDADGDVDLAELEEEKVGKSGKDGAAAKSGTGHGASLGIATMLQRLAQLRHDAWVAGGGESEGAPASSSGSGQASATGGTTSAVTASYNASITGSLSTRPRMRFFDPTPPLDIGYQHASGKQIDTSPSGGSPLHAIISRILLSSPTAPAPGMESVIEAAVAASPELFEAVSHFGPAGCAAEQMLRAMHSGSTPSPSMLLLRSAHPFCAAVAIRALMAVIRARTSAVDKKASSVLAIAPRAQRMQRVYEHARSALGGVGVTCVLSADREVMVSLDAVGPFTLPARALSDGALISTSSTAERRQLHIWSSILPLPSGGGFSSDVHGPLLLHLSRSVIARVLAAPGMSEAHLAGRVPGFPLTDLRMLLRWLVGRGALARRFSCSGDYPARPSLFSPLVSDALHAGTGSSGGVGERRDEEDEGGKLGFGPDGDTSVSFLRSIKAVLPEVDCLEDAVCLWEGAGQLLLGPKDGEHKVQGLGVEGVPASFADDDRASLLLDLHSSAADPCPLPGLVTRYSPTASTLHVLAAIHRQLA